jgi:hypothetical protein
MELFEYSKKVPDGCIQDLFRNRFFGDFERKAICFVLKMGISG